MTTGSSRFVAPRSDAEWTAGLAYAVGLIATDGCLSPNGKAVVQTSVDRELLETFKTSLGTLAPIRSNQRALRVEICDVGLYTWLESIGLTPRKSLTLGAIAVPDAVFAHFVRGLLDGDGSVVFSTVVPNPRRYPDHTYPRLRMQFLSASGDHIVWLRDHIRDLYSLKGWLQVRRQHERAPMYALRYSKHEAITLLTELYRDPSAPRLERKFRIWNAFMTTAPATRIWTRRSGVMAAS